MRRFIAVSFLVLSAMIASCSSKPPKIQDAHLHVAPHNALATLQNRTLQYRANVERWIKGDRVRVQVYMMAQAPDHVRVDLMTQIGPSAILTFDGATLAYFEQSSRVLQEGAFCESMLSDLIGIALQPRDLLALLLASPESLSGNEKQVVSKREIVKAQQKDSGEKQNLIYRAAKKNCVKGPALQLEKAERFDATGRRQWRVQYADYQNHGAGQECVELPHLMRFVGREGHEVRVEVQEIRIRENIEDSMFRQIASPGTHVKALECADAPR